MSRPNDDAAIAAVAREFAGLARDAPAVVAAGARSMHDQNALACQQPMRPLTALGRPLVPAQVDDVSAVSYRGDLTIVSMYGKADIRALHA